MAAAPEVVAGNVRVQLLSPNLVRIEQKGPEGFEDRETLLVRERSWPGTKFTRGREAGGISLKTALFSVRIQADGKDIGDVEVLSPEGEALYAYDGEGAAAFKFPSPREMKWGFAVVDSPRMVPPPWGATPAPAGAIPSTSPLVKTSGWDISNSAPDVYVFIKGGSSYEEVRKIYLRLTGRVPLPPLYVLGFWDSRYHAYTEHEALEVIDRYRDEGIPLDVFVVDTDWRTNASDGYDVNTKLFPDMARFIREAHERKARVIFNDHPVAKAEGLDPGEMEYRYASLTKYLSMGLDAWWFDKNWQNIIESPVEGLDQEGWGQIVYHDTMARFMPERRPFLMSMRSSYPGSRRYPIWWTGDNESTFTALREGVADSVNDGIALMPWVHQDLGGHKGYPSSELYTRFVEWGCLSPVTRVHCTKGPTRYPWAFGDEVQRIVTNYVKLRYRLLPVLYSAAYRSFEDGTPILRRCDLYWPQYDEAADDSQYLLGDDILVAPYAEDVRVEAISWTNLRAPDGTPGLRGEYFTNKELKGEPALTRVDKSVAFSWQNGSPDEKIGGNGFSARWTGKLGNIATTGEYALIVTYDDGVRLWLDGKQLIDEWDLNSVTSKSAKVKLQKGHAYDVRLEYFENTGGATCRLQWVRPESVAGRAVWLPPGEWEDAWTGELHEGPTTVKRMTPLWLTPMYIRRGAIIALAPEMFYTAEKKWDPLTVEVFPAASGTTARMIYEDDGLTNAYLKGQRAITWLGLTREKPKQIDFMIRGTQGNYAGALKSRQWIVRLHLRPGEIPSGLWLDGKQLRIDPTSIAGIKAPFAKVVFAAKEPRDGEELPMPLGGEDTAPPYKSGPVIEIHLDRQAVTTSHRLTLMLK